MQTKLPTLLASVFTIIFLTACNDSSSHHNYSVANNTSVSGTAATGAPIIGRVCVSSIQGESSCVQIETDGHYSIDTSGMDGPLILAAIPDNPTYPTQYSWSLENDGIANITAFTTLALAMVGDYGNLPNWAEAWSTYHKRIDPDKLQQAITSIQALFGGILEAVGVRPDVDFFKDAFAANGEGLDAFYDLFDVAFDWGAGTVTFNGVPIKIPLNPDDFDLPDLTMLEISESSGPLLSVSPTNPSQPMMQDSLDDSGALLQSVSPTNPSWLNGVDLQNADIETLIMLTQSERVRLLDAQLVDQVRTLQQLNNQVVQLDLIRTSLIERIDSVPDASSTAVETGCSASSLPTADSFWALEGGEFDDFDRNVISTCGQTNADLNAVVQSIEAVIDVQLKKQQMEILRLQSLNNKKNESIEILTNIQKKYQDSYSNIIRNI